VTTLNFNLVLIPREIFLVMIILTETCFQSVFQVKNWPA
jgi:hypothetical protein